MTDLTAALRDFEGEDIALLEPRDFYDQFIVGLAQRFNQHFVIYDKDALIAGLVKQAVDEDDELDLLDAETGAIEHFEYNIVGSWVGDGTPAFLTTYGGENGSDDQDVRNGGRIHEAGKDDG